MRMFSSLRKEVKMAVMDKTANQNGPGSQAPKAPLCRSRFFNSMKICRITLPLGLLPVRLPILVHSGEGLHVEIIPLYVALVHPIMVADVERRMILNDPPPKFYHR